MATLLRFMTYNVTQSITSHLLIQIHAWDTRTWTISRECNYICVDVIHALRERAHLTQEYH